MDDKTRIIFLATIFSAIVVTLGKSMKPLPVTYPTRKIDTYTFPESVALSAWKLAASKSVNAHLVASPGYISGNFIAGKQYRYRQNQQLLEIEMRYFRNTNGDLKSFILSQTGELSPVLHQDSAGGFYSLYTYQNKAYLSSCINPSGNSTVTSDRFKRNRVIHDTRLQRIIPWLLGQQELHDHRCLWAHLAISLTPDMNLNETNHILETVWHDWHDWWRANYPEACYLGLNFHGFFQNLHSK